MIPQFTGRTPDRAPNRVLATVRVNRLGFSGFKMGNINSNIRLSLGFLHFPGWRLSFRSTSLVNFRQTDHPSGLPIPLLFPP